VKFIETTDTQQELDDISTVGNYALQLKWFDGHDSGLYSYKYLRALCRCAECSPVEAEGDRPELPRM